MSDQSEKSKNATRRHRDEVAVQRQVRIAKQHGIEVSEPHRYAKHHALNCGNSGCYLCGNPRKIFNELTYQEKRIQQNVEDSDQSEE
jgi:hypothetical protein